jgi:hypothetical protein
MSTLDPQQAFIFCALPEEFQRADGQLILLARIALHI